jgi:hypothetical protein
MPQIEMGKVKEPTASCGAPGVNTLARTGDLAQFVDKSPLVFMLMLLCMVVLIITLLIPYLSSQLPRNATGASVNEDNSSISGVNSTKNITP